MKKSSAGVKFLILMVVGFFFMGGCRSLSFKPPEQVLRDRVTSMMAARVNQDWAKVYNYLDPDYKTQVSKKEFAGMDRNARYSDVSIESVKIADSGEQAVVVVQYDWVLPLFEVPDHRETQDWIKIGGKWYFKMKTDGVMEKD